MLTERRINTITDMIYRIWKNFLHSDDVRLHIIRKYDANIAGRQWVDSISDEAIAYHVAKDLRKLYPDAAL